MSAKLVSLHGSILRVKSALRIQKGNSVNAVPFFKTASPGVPRLQQCLRRRMSQYKGKHGLDIELFRKIRLPVQKGIPDADAGGIST